MNEFFSKSWGRVAVRGAVSLLFGILIALWQDISLRWLIIMFTGYAVIGGFAYVTAAVQNRKSANGWWMLLMIGLIGVGTGAAIIMVADLPAVKLALVIGAAATATGILDITMAIHLRRAIRGESFLFMAGSLSVMFGISVSVFPGTGPLSLAWLISIYAIITGGLLLMLAWRARGWKNSDDIASRHTRHTHRSS